VVLPADNAHVSSQNGVMENSAVDFVLTAHIIFNKWRLAF
jgi:hypothetical protein